MNDSNIKIKTTKTYLFNDYLQSKNKLEKRQSNKNIIIENMRYINIFLLIIIFIFIVFSNLHKNFNKNQFTFNLEQQLNISKEIIKIYSSLFNVAKNQLNKGPQKIINYIPKNENFKEKKGIAICSIGKNENLYVKEYVEYYLKLGIKKIIIYDNNDINGEKFEDILEKFIKINFVEIINIRGFHSSQIPIYNLCYKTYNIQFDYIAFLDFDEFITIKENLNINKYLYNSKFQKCETILLNWVIYGDNDLEKYDNRSLVERFTKPNKKVKRGKSIVRTDISNLIIVTTLIIGVNTKYFCDSNGKRIFPNSYYNFEPPQKSQAFIKHFFTKTVEEFCIKLKRGDAHFYKGQSDYKRIMNGRISTFMRINKIKKSKLKILEKCTGIHLRKYRYKVKNNYLIKKYI